MKRSIHVSKGLKAIVWANISPGFEKILGAAVWGGSPGFRGDSGCCFGTERHNCLLIFTGYSPRHGEDEYIPTLLNLKMRKATAPLGAISKQTHRWRKERKVGIRERKVWQPHRRKKQSALQWILHGEHFQHQLHVTTGDPLLVLLCTSCTPPCFGIITAVRSLAATPEKQIVRASTDPPRGALSASTPHHI